MHLPTTTLKDLAFVVVLIANVAWDGTKRTLKRLRRHVEPPADLHVRSDVGGLYSGVLLVDKNEIIAGIVFRTGHEPSGPSPVEPSPIRPSPTFGSPLSGVRERGPRPPWRPRPTFDPTTLASRFAEEDEDDDCKLPGWAEDPREESSWL